MTAKIDVKSQSSPNWSSRCWKSPKRLKLGNALRASRVTELRESFPAHIVDAWLGHDDNIARKHYAQTLDEHYDRATQECSHLASCRDSHDDALVHEVQKKKIRTKQHCFARGCTKMGDEGLEPPTSTV